MCGSEEVSVLDARAELLQALSVASERLGVIAGAVAAIGREDRQGSASPCPIVCMHNHQWVSLSIGKSWWESPGSQDHGCKDDPWPNVGEVR